MELLSIAGQLAFKTGKSKLKRLVNITMADVAWGALYGCVGVIKVGGYAMWVMSVLLWHALSLGVVGWRDAAPLVGDAVTWCAGCWFVWFQVAICCKLLGVGGDGGDYPEDEHALVSISHSFLFAPTVLFDFVSSYLPNAENFFGTISFEALALRIALPYLIMARAWLPVASLTYSWHLLRSTHLVSPATPIQLLPVRFLMCLISVALFPLTVSQKVFFWLGPAKHLVTVALCWYCRGWANDAVDALPSSFEECQSAYFTLGVAMCTVVGCCSSIYMVLEQVVDEIFIV